MERYLSVFNHGLGDAVQFTAVLQHLRKFHPEWEHDVCCLKGKHTAFGGLAGNFLHEPETKNYTKVIRHNWPECYESWNDSPGTKAVNCLRHMFQITPVWELLRYSVQISEATRGRAAAYLDALPCERGFVFIHYEGNTSQDAKNLSHETIQQVCEYLVDGGYTPIIFDWDRRSPVPDNKTVFCPGVDHPLWLGWGTGCAETIAALLERATLFIGIDSGPQKVAFAVGCPTLAVWTGLHPYHYADHCVNTLHLVRHGHEGRIRGGNKEAGLAFFRERYEHVLYHDVAEELLRQVGLRLGLNPMVRSRLLKSASYDATYYHEHAAAGLDYAAYGDWQQEYGRWFVDALELRGKAVLDVGCACGSIARGLQEAGAVVTGVDVSEHMIRLGRENWQFPLHVCDAVNLHVFADESFDCLHSAQVFEHFKPELVPFILKELARVTKPGGVLFAAFDTTELFDRQHRGEHEDATHICVRPMAWWHERFQEAGWVLAPDLLSALKDHRDSYFKKYDWPAVCCKK